MKLRPSRRRPAPSADAATWYKDAIIYELRVRSFFDSNDDGIGDLRGLTSKLDYLADLGITAIWLLPFYPSPLRDDGYDISDYTNVHADLGTLEDFRSFLEEAHARGLRVITELVLNHTSDQHPWFQRARRAPRGSKERDFYVWSEDGALYEDARIIFNDFESSNWTRDAISHDYFWHRFYSHQPDLNFENPAVQDALLQVVDFWLALGVDGLRLDAVPYLYEEAGTTCENLPKTHAFLRKLRAHVDTKFPNRMLLAEANQWPEDAAAYFGADDECHMNFHFPIMPRMFMAIHMEDSLPIADILAQTPTPPPSCQWALFLRNHDELTLETVTSDERDYMYRAYASDTAARINLGIRRRLAPLVENDRRKIELLNGLLLSLAGTPVVYYGDEIGMGDNVYLGDRDGVRTPMQWSMDRNAGFSRASAQRLILPVNVEATYHYESVNVEAQQASSGSLLWWMKRTLDVRRESRVFGRGSLEVVATSNPRVLAYLRRFEGETVLVVANMARSVQFVEIQLPSYNGLRPVEMFGGSDFPPIGDAPYTLTLGGHAFYWLSLEAPQGGADAVEATTADEAPVVGAAHIDILVDRDRAVIEQRLPEYLGQQPWFRAQHREAVRAHVVHSVTLGENDGAFRWTTVRVEYADGGTGLYALALAIVSSAAVREGRSPSVTALVRVRAPDSSETAGAVIDVLEEPATSRAIFEALAASASHGGPDATLVSTLTKPVEALRTLRMLPGHASAIAQIDDRYILKTFRNLTDGPSVDAELSRAMAPRLECSGPELLGSMALVGKAVEPFTLSILEPYVNNAGTVWDRVLPELGRYFDQILTTHRGDAVPAHPGTAPSDAPPLVSDLMGPFLDSMTMLGERIAEMHGELMKLVGRDLAPELNTKPARREDYQILRTLAVNVLRDLRAHRMRMSDERSADAVFVLSREPLLLKELEAVLSEIPLRRARVHGNLHLEQILWTGKDFVFLDYEGELDRSIKERRRKQLPLRDVAGVLRSLDNASLVSLWESTRVRAGDREALAPWASLWTSWAGAAVLTGYRQTAVGATLAPTGAPQIRRLLVAFGLERALRDLRTELRWGTGGALIPLRSIAQHLALAEEAATAS